MLESHGTGWKLTGHLLESERASMAPVTTIKSRQHTTGIYMLFLLEFIIITLPVQEETALIHLYGFFKWLWSKLGSDPEKNDLNGPLQPESLASKVRVEYQRQKEAQSNRNQLSSVLRGALLLTFSLLRAVFYSTMGSDGASRLRCNVFVLWLCWRSALGKYRKCHSQYYQAIRWSPACSTLECRKCSCAKAWVERAVRVDPGDGQTRPRGRRERPMRMELFLGRIERTISAREELPEDSPGVSPYGAFDCFYSV